MTIVNNNLWLEAFNKIANGIEKRMITKDELFSVLMEVAGNIRIPQKPEHNWREHTCGECSEPADFLINEEGHFKCVGAFLAGGASTEPSIQENTAYCRKRRVFIAYECPACRDFEPREVPE